MSPSLTGSHASRRERYQLEHPRERPAGERLDPGELARADPHGAQETRSTRKTASVPHDRRDREPGPATPDQVDRAPPEPHEPVGPALRRSHGETPATADSRIARRPPPPPRASSVAPEDEREEPDGDREDDAADHRGRREHGVALPDSIERSITAMTGRRRFASWFQMPVSVTARVDLRWSSKPHVRRRPYEPAMPTMSAAGGRRT